MFEKFVRALPGSETPKGTPRYWQEALLHRFGKECGVSCPSSLRQITKIFEADIKRLSKVANDTPQPPRETTMDIATVRPQSKCIAKPCRHMFVVKVFENDEERFGAIQEAIANDDYNIVCAMSAGPHLLDSYTTRFEQLAQRGELPEHLRHAEIRCLINRTTKEAFSNLMFATIWSNLCSEIHVFASMPYIILTQPNPGSSLFRLPPQGLSYFHIEIRVGEFVKAGKPLELCDMQTRHDRKVALFQLDLSPNYKLNYTDQLIRGVSGVSGDLYYFVCLDDYRLTDKERETLRSATSAAEQARILVEEIGPSLSVGH